MSKLTARVSTGEADYIAATVAPVAQIETWDADSVTVTIVIGDTARAHLESLPEDSDGHLDGEGRIWIDGSPIQLEVVHNA